MANKSQLLSLDDFQNMSDFEENNQSKESMNSQDQFKKQKSKSSQDKGGSFKVIQEKKIESNELFQMFQHGFSPIQALEKFKQPQPQQQIIKGQLTPMDGFQLDMFKQPQLHTAQQKQPSEMIEYQSSVRQRFDQLKQNSRSKSPLVNQLDEFVSDCKKKLKGRKAKFENESTMKKLPQELLIQTMKEDDLSPKEFQQFLQFKEQVHVKRLIELRQSYEQFQQGLEQQKNGLLKGVDQVVAKAKEASDILLKQSETEIRDKLRLLQLEMKDQSNKSNIIHSTVKPVSEKFDGLNSQLTELQDQLNRWDVSKQKQTAVLPELDEMIGRIQLAKQDKFMRKDPKLVSPIAKKYLVKASPIKQDRISPIRKYEERRRELSYSFIRSGRDKREEYDKILMQGRGFNKDNDRSNYPKQEKRIIPPSDNTVTWGTIMRKSELFREQSLRKNTPSSYQRKASSSKDRMFGERSDLGVKILTDNRKNLMVKSSIIQPKVHKALYSQHDTFMNYMSQTKLSGKQL